MSRRLQRWGIRRSVVVSATSVLSLILVLAGLLLRAQLRSALEQSITDQTLARVEAAAELVNDGDVTDAVAPSERTPGWVQIVDSSGHVVRGSANIIEPSLPVAPLIKVGERSVARRWRGLRVDPEDEMVAAYVAATLRGQPVTVIAVAPLDLADATDDRVLKVLLVVFPALVALAAFVLHRAASRALRPVEAIRAEVASITAAPRLSRRVTVPPSNDEIARLATTMNETLDRLDGSTRRERRFVADASHELRSPLASLRTQLDVALSEGADADWSESAVGIRLDVQRLERLVADLLILARSDDGQPTILEPIDLGHLARSEVRRRLPVEGVEIVVDADNALVAGNELTLTRVLRNLLDNAQRHARSRVGVSVQVAARDAGSVVELRVVNDGARIADADRERIFDRFHRLDEARSTDAGGSGLGLAIVSEIVSAHHGTVVAEAVPEGASFLVRLPLLVASDLD